MLALLLLVACADCHKTQTEQFVRSGMGKALTPVRQTVGGVLGQYVYRIENAILTVTDGKQKASTPLKWTFGAGSVGQTWLYEKDGRWYESRVSYYNTLKGLDLTIGQAPPRTLDEAAGRQTSITEAKRCFSCHTITCETCHGDQPHAGKLKQMNAEAHNDFCGECHRTWAQIAANGPMGIQNIRFQPYRLALSKCANLKCATCHDSHSGAVNDPKCVTCHQSCRAGNKDNCVGCHMPRLELPGAHAKFTDHRIRVVKPNERYPD